MTTNSSSSSSVQPSFESDLKKRGPYGAQPSVSSPKTRNQEQDKEDSKKTNVPSPSSLSGSGQLPSQGSLLIALLLTAASLFTRLYKIGWANFVVWDEAHFGKFASHYIKRTFYHDVHPPLGKMLNGIAGMMARYNGQFKFDSGGTYPEDLNYTFMRTFNALFGALLVPIAYYTGIHLKLSHPAAIFLAWLVLCDLALCNISRFILLDSMLLFFTALSAYTLVVFYNYQQIAPFTKPWFKWMVLTGMSIGAVASVKWVGLFAIALVGLHTLQDLWEMFGDLKMPISQYAKHWGARMIALIAVPIIIYMMSFKMHFAILNRSGEGDATMSSLFQANLVGIDFSSNPLEIAFGSKVTIKNYARAGALLHSHIQRFPEGSGQQQVTAYPHKDDNNDWILTRPWGYSGQPKKNDRGENEVEFIQDGDVLRLVHSGTGRNLHSHRIPAPLTKSEYEVSCYGNATVGDINDHWVIERIDDLRLSKKYNRIRCLTTRFRLRHVTTGCLLGSHTQVLPGWGFGQNEVYCQKNGDDKSRNIMWNIEKHVNDRLPPAGAQSFKSSFFHDFADLNVAMWASNNALTPDMDKQDDLVSQPYQWPLMLVGLRMCGWGDNAIKYFLLGTPVVWWGSTLALIALSFTILYHMVRYRRGYKDFRSVETSNDFYFAAKIGLLGWILHYIPFWIMGRVTYLHHYFPALYFAIIAAAVIVDHWTRSLTLKAKWTIFGVLGLLVLANFVYFIDFAWGMAGPAEEYKGRRWIQSWRLYGDE